LLVAFATLSTLGGASVAFSGSAGAATAPTGSASGFYSKISLFGGPPTTCGSPATVPCPRPVVSLPAPTLKTKTLPSVAVVYGPAEILDSGPVRVTTQGPALTGKVTSTSSLQGCTTAVSNGCNVGEVYAGPFTAANVSSTCTAGPGTFTASTTVTGGKLQNGSSFYTIPLHPVPNRTYTGTNPDTGKIYKFVFNQRTLNPNGSHTVTAVHEYLNAGANGAQGNLTFGTVTCGM
jgi:hypothetical protein